MFLETSSRAVGCSNFLKSILPHIYIVLNQPYLRPAGLVLVCSSASSIPFFGLKEISSNLAEKPALGFMDEIILSFFSHCDVAQREFRLIMVKHHWIRKNDDQKVKSQLYCDMIMFWPSVNPLVFSEALGLKPRAMLVGWLCMFFCSCFAATHVLPYVRDCLPLWQLIIQVGGLPLAWLTGDDLSIQMQPLPTDDPDLTSILF